MVPLEDMMKFMDANMVRIRVLVCQVQAVLADSLISNLRPNSASKLHTGVNKSNGVLLRKCTGLNCSNGVIFTSREAARSWEGVGSSFYYSWRRLLSFLSS